MMQTFDAILLVLILILLTLWGFAIDAARRRNLERTLKRNSVRSLKQPVGGLQIFAYIAGAVALLFLVIVAVSFAAS